MSAHSKSALAHSDAVRSAQLYRIAIVGAATLKGKEVAEVLGDRSFPSLEVKLLDDDEAIGQLESLGDEISFIQSTRGEQFEKVDFTFFASDQAGTRKLWKRVRDAGGAIVDLTFALEDEPGAMVRSPWIERLRGQTLAPELQPGPVVVAHPASVVLALLLLRAQKAGGVTRAVATVFEPASEHGQKGMDELHEQTVNLLSFQKLPKNIFDAQVAFNLLTRYGDQSTPPLASVQERVLKHFLKIAGPEAALPSVLLVQAPIFHGHAFALHLEFESAPDMGKVTQSLQGEHVNITQVAEDAPSNVNAAGQPDIQLAIASDGTNPKGLWLWAAADNLRVLATTAVECAETMTATRPLGKIQ